MSLFVTQVESGRDPAERNGRREPTAKRPRTLTVVTRYHVFRQRRTQEPTEPT